MISQTIHINGEHLAYFDSKKGEQTLLFIHGAFINKGYWKHQLAYFKDRYRVVAIDLAGHGESTHHRSTWTGATFGRDVLEFMQQLSLENVILVGHSFGSDVMLETAALCTLPRVIGLVEVDHLKNVGDEMPEETINYLMQQLKTDFAATCEQYARQALVTEKTAPELVSRLLSDYTTMSPEVGIPFLQNGFRYAKREVQLLNALDQKLHLLHVNYTPTDEQKLRACLGDHYELHHLEGTCHYPMLENPDGFNAALEKIVATMGSYSV